jgi:membrane glycosyltransferase
MLFMLALELSSMMLLLRKFMLGKYMPTHSSTKQNAQKTKYSWDGMITADSSETLANVMAALRMNDALPTSCELLAILNNVDPAIMQHMKQAKMMPKGGSSLMPETWRALTTAADQKNTKRYIMDSNKDEAVVRAKMRLSGFAICQSVIFHLAPHIMLLLQTSPHFPDRSECHGKERSPGHIICLAAVVFSLVSLSSWIESRIKVIRLTHVELIHAAVPPSTTAASKNGDILVPVSKTNISPVIPVVIATTELQEVSHP